MVLSTVNSINSKSGFNTWLMKDKTNKVMIKKSIKSLVKFTVITLLNNKLQFIQLLLSILLNKCSKLKPNLKTRKRRTKSKKKNQKLYKLLKLFQLLHRNIDYQLNLKKVSKWMKKSQSLLSKKWIWNSNKRKIMQIIKILKPNDYIR
jgi:hypothetical protein